MPRTLLKKRIFDAQSLLSWIGTRRISPLQKNALFESDAEILKLASDSYLGISVDQLCEEIRHGLYHSPETIGRIAIESALSDLAAAGVSPLGVVVGAQWRDNISTVYKRKVYASIEKTLRLHGTYLLGGDTSSAAETSLSVTAIGHSKTPPLQRVGARSGEVLVTTGSYGMGPALGFQMFEKVRAYDEKKFNPRARLYAGTILKKYASCAMDTSDGFAATLATLESVNGVGFSVNEGEIPYAPLAMRFMHKAGLPRTALLFGEVGDFEILATVPRKNMAALARALPEMRPIGLTVKNPAKSSINLGGGDKKSKLIPVNWAINQEKEKDSLGTLYKVYQEMLDTLRALQLP